MENKPTEQDIAALRKRRFTRNLIICIVAIIALIAIFWLFASQPTGEEVGYDQFTTDLNNNTIAEVEISNSRTSYKTKDGEWHWFYTRNSVENETIDLVVLWNNGVDVYNQEHSGDPDFVALTKVKTAVGTSSTFNFLSLLYPILLIIVLIVTAIMIGRMIRNVGSRGNEFTKNRARVAVSKVHFDRVAGADEEKAELEEIIQFLKDPEKFTRVGARIPKGVLLVGPPGTGKTLLAKAVAGEANVPFFTISGSDFMELYVGVGASRVRDLFENAKLAKPCIVFIDEIDAVGRQRGTGLGGGNDEREQTLNQLLVQMDGFEPNEGIIVMAATNRADILDPALTRPGRFDRQIYISSPDVKGREEILRVHAEGKPLASDVSLKEIARVTSGFTGADLENLLNEAAILAARQNHQRISMQNINDAVVKVSIGPQKRSRVVSEKDKRITAYHESGHAIVGKLVKTGDPVHEVSIIQRGPAAGYTLQRPDNDNEHITRQKLYDELAIFLAGRASEELFLEDITVGASNDIQRATQIARKMVTEWGMSSEIGLVNLGEGSEIFLGRDYQTRTSYSEVEASKIDVEVRKIIESCYAEAKKILSAHKKQIETMVSVLLEKETIYADEVDMILAGKSKEEVITYIEERMNRRKEEEQKEKAKREAEALQAAEAEKAQADKPNQNQTSAGDYVSNLLKEAERRKAENENAAHEKETQTKQAAKPVTESAESQPAEPENKPAPKPRKPRSPKAGDGQAKPKATATKPKTETKDKKDQGTN